MPYDNMLLLTMVSIFSFSFLMVKRAKWRALIKGLGWGNSRSLSTVDLFLERRVYQTNTNSKLITFKLKKETYKYKYYLNRSGLSP